ncbi:biotin-dependent carboxylase-like uncharacterized protein [Orenia metallireducens]|jgi:biotin-dependent carboxylase-like uncharacterized protein|uniref:Biotin-dependent carboxylase uncharacterized domain-containing protein n=1 Tax=Orenia metallireducens TaxID=1413210 RepID=A0A285I582_9FIRM|nr:biotin-dependent carboxyltransferase family protein [Orenia metallireducens]PRX19719.1 biotin-dependent carboxylase-like uncharacterized protein [Orenia metallireducens]SNY43130.1 biotin-dependent carboxylase uncharacterized domain-containing protein [Orenia metallireducens]
MGSLIVNKPGLLTTVQDQGRYGYQRYGMPVAGAMDSYAFQIANLLVGNERSAPALELTLLGPEIIFEDSFRIAITGGELGAEINGKRIYSWSSVKINSGDRLTFKGAQQGCRAYLSVSGGIEVEEVMGSSSTYLRGQLGGYLGRSLKSGDSLKIVDTNKGDFSGIIKVPTEYLPEYKDKSQIRVVKGPQFNRFSQSEIDKFFNSKYLISTQSDRMGYRLEGARISHQQSSDIISEGISLGAIQIPGDGQPIIMMVDHQTTGGYTKIANVISVDIATLAQMKPSEEISFSMIDIKEAQSFYHQREAMIRELEQMINKIYLIYN